LRTTFSADNDSTRPLMDAPTHARSFAKTRASSGTSRRRSTSRRPLVQRCFCPCIRRPARA